MKVLTWGGRTVPCEGPENTALGTVPPLLSWGERTTLTTAKQQGPERLRVRFLC